MKTKFNIEAANQYLARINTWILVVGILALVVGGYYTVLGIRYWNASKQIPDLTAQSNTLLRTLRSEGPEERDIELELDAQVRTLEQAQALFSYPQTDDLIGILSSTAQSSNIVLASATVGEQLPKVQGEIQYITQPISVSVQGQPDTIFRWLELLHRTVPVVGVPSFRISSLDSIPSARIDFVFFLSPSPLEGQQGVSQ